jgi:transcriptional regulator with XRE-family HTH domain
MGSRRRGQWVSSEEGASSSTNQLARIRKTLTAAREAKRWATERVAERLVELGGIETFSGEGVRLWEKGENTPPIVALAEWASALDYELLLDVVPKADRFLQLPVRADLKSLVRRMSASLPEQDVALLVRLVRVLAELPDDTEYGARHRSAFREAVLAAERETNLARGKGYVSFPDPEDE